MYLRCGVHDAPAKWASWLPQAKFWYNSTFHSSLGCTPYKALYGHKPNIGYPPATGPSLNPDVQTWLSIQTQHIANLKEHLAKAQFKYK